MDLPLAIELTYSPLDKDSKTFTERLNSEMRSEAHMLANDGCYMLRETVARLGSDVFEADGSERQKKAGLYLIPIRYAKETIDYRPRTYR